MSATQPQGSVPPAVFVGQLSSFNKPKLQEICLALGFAEAELKNTKDTLANNIRGVLENDTVLAENSRFVGLAWKPKPAKAAKRSSANKAADDAAANASKTADALTGANLTLHGKKVTTDPAPKFAALGLQSGDKPPKKGPHGKAKAMETDGYSSLSSMYPSDKEEDKPSDKEDDKKDKSDVGEEDDVIPAPPPRTPSPRPVPGGGPKMPLVFVSFKNLTQPNLRSEEVCVQNAKVFTSTSPGGAQKHEVELSDLIPKALAKASPIKADREGRLSRTGIFDAADLMGVGYVKQHLDEGEKVPPNLTFDIGNKIELSGHGDVLGLELYYKPSAIQPFTIHSAPVPVPVPHHLTGASTDKPLEIAQYRIIPPPQVLLNTESLNRFLNEFAGYEAKGKGTNKYGGHMLNTYNDYKPYQDAFKVFNKGQGYYIPLGFKPAPDVEARLTVGWEEFQNGTFTQEVIIKSTRLTRTLVRNLLSMFSKIKEMGGPLYDWMKAPRPSTSADSDSDAGEPAKFSYEKMKQVDLFALVDELWKDHIAEKPEPYKKKKKGSKSSKASSSKASGSKHRRGDDDDKEKNRKRHRDSGGGDDERKKRSRKGEEEGGKGKGRAMDSEDLDDSSD
ncbi:hypothetical protein C8R47DRAFT_1226999 [Mycena vitilis]|nr:hypothetical protein C8R47DRAFT_1226999 [Mycena vitilis]